MALVKISQKNLILDIRYGTNKNITGKQLYRDYVPQLEEIVAESFAKACQAVDQLGFGVVLFDAYRSRAVQSRLQAACSDARYVVENSNHCLGLAVDITLADKEGVYLDMGTDFDEFSERSHLDATGITEAQRHNRELLARIMEEYQFKQWPFEWWHFDFQEGAHA